MMKRGEGKGISCDAMSAYYLKLKFYVYSVSLKSMYSFFTRLILDIYAYLLCQTAINLVRFCVSSSLNELSLYLYLLLLTLKNFMMDRFFSDCLQHPVIECGFC